MSHRLLCGSSMSHSAYVIPTVEATGGERRLEVDLSSKVRMIGQCQAAYGTQIY